MTVATPGSRIRNRDRKPRARKERLSRLFRLDAGVLDHFRGFDELRLDEFAEFLGRARKRLEPDIGDLRLHLGVVDDLAHLPVEPGDDFTGRPGRREKSGPGFDLETGEA